MSKEYDVAGWDLEWAEEQLIPVLKPLAQKIAKEAIEAFLNEGDSTRVAICADGVVLEDDYCLASGKFFPWKELLVFDRNSAIGLYGLLKEWSEFWTEAVGGEPLPEWVPVPVSEGEEQ